MTAAAEDLLVVEDLCVDLDLDAGHGSGREPVRVVEDVSFTVAPGETVGIAGESGSGKTLTALSVVRLLPEIATARGRVRFRGRDVLTMDAAGLRQLRGGQVGVVFQDPMTSLHPAYRVGDQIAEMVRLHRDMSRRRARAHAVAMLEAVGIPDPALRARQYPHEFSGGMQQRAMIAMAVACDPALLIADEPTTALDATVQAQIVDLFRDLHASRGMAVIFVSHDLGLLEEVCDRTVVMYGGHVVESGPTGPVMTEPAHPYTSALLASAPSLAHKGGRLPTIPGAPPRPESFPPGCRFEPRCGCAVAACTSAVPVLVPAGPDRAARCVRVADEAVTP